MPRDLLLMSISLFTWGIGEGMFLYFQSLYLQQWGANPVEIGGILGLMGIIMALVQAPAGYLADRVGPRPIMWSSWVLGTIATMIMAAANSMTMFVAGLLIYGMTSFVAAPMNSYITSVRGKWSVERALTTVSAMFYLGAVAGPVIGGLIGQRLGLPTVYRISAGIFILSTAIIFFVRRAPAQAVSNPADARSGETRQPVSSLAKNSRFMSFLGMVALTMFALYLPQPLTSNYLQNQRHFDLAMIGWMGSVGSLSNAVLMLALGRLSAPVGFLVGQALVGVFALMMWLSNSPALFFVGYFFIGGYRLSRAMALAFARMLVRPEETGLAYGLVETGNAIATIAAPLVAGLLYNQNPAWIYIASLAGIGMVIIANRALAPGLKKTGAVAPGEDQAAEEAPSGQVTGLADPSSEEFLHGV